MGQPWWWGKTVFPDTLYCGHQSRVIQFQLSWVRTAYHSYVTWLTTWTPQGQQGSPQNCGHTIWKSWQMRKWCHTRPKKARNCTADATKITKNCAAGADKFDTRPPKNLGNPGIVWNGMTPPLSPLEDPARPSLAHQENGTFRGICPGEGFIGKLGDTNTREDKWATRIFSLCLFLFSPTVLPPRILFRSVPPQNPEFSRNLAAASGPKY